MQLAFRVFLLELFFRTTGLSVNSVLSLQGDMPTFCFEVLYHFCQGLVVYWLFTSIFDRQMVSEANMMVPSKQLQ